MTNRVSQLKSGSRAITQDEALAAQRHLTLRKATLVIKSNNGSVNIPESLRRYFLTAPQAANEMQHVAQLSSLVQGTGNAQKLLCSKVTPAVQPGIP